METMKVAGGWLARDPDLKIACLGRTKEEAEENLAEARSRAKKLEAVAAATWRRDDSATQ